MSYIPAPRPDMKYFFSPILLFEIYAVLAFKKDLKYQAWIKVEQLKIK